MSESQDFERMWLSKFATCLDQEVGVEVRKYIMEGSEQLSSTASREDVIQWTREAMERLDSSVDDSHRHAVMTGCACQYPASDLQEIRSIYAETKDLDQVHSLLQQKLETFLREDLDLEEQLINEVVSRGWGLAGFKEGKTIIATKIPKSGDLKDYFNEVDPQARRELYCHCPRVRDAVAANEKTSMSYCYCGAGFYKALWEEITQEPVYVEMLESVLAGDDACKIAIYLP